jgi:cytochrome oxidase Cu insertion factor (SCO1/SenC/PrrC family)
MTEAPTAKSALKGRLILAALFALFFLPIFLAWALNVELPHWLPFGKTNHGQLIEPAERFVTPMLTGVDGAPVDEALIRGKWTLVYIEPAACLEECDRAVYRMRQSRHAMGKDMDRVQGLVIAPEPLAREAAGKLIAYDPALTILAAAPEWIERPRAAAGQAQIYIVDPQGYLVMWYRADADPAGLIKDLKRLLKISKIG